MFPIWENLDALLERMNQVFERHKDYEYEVNTWEGKTKILFGIIKLCLDEDMFRYSSTIRAFDTWSGLGYGDAKPTNVLRSL